MTAVVRCCLILAALSGLLSVIAGAFAAHGMANPVTAEWVKTGASYEMTHALAVFACVFVAQLGGRRAMVAAGLFLAGAVLFSGSLYAVALGAPKALAAATPVGGLLFMAGWIVLAWACMSLRKSA